MTKKIYTREELEKLATENPNGLALVFARKVVRDKYAVDTMSGDHGPEPAVHGAVQAVRELGAHVMLSDWTAVINAGKNVGMFWWKHHDVGTPDLGEFYAGPYPYYSVGAKRCDQQPNWPDCAALMIVMIEVTQHE